MPYNSVTTRANVQALIAEQVSDIMLTSLPQQSAAMKMFTRINVPTNKTRFPVLSALPVAYFVDGDTGLKQTTSAAWDNKYLEVEEIAAIVPIPDAVFEDANFDVWGTIRPLLEGAIARTLDAAVLFGTNKPTSWPVGVAPAAITALCSRRWRLRTPVCALSGWTSRTNPTLPATWMWRLSLPC